MTETAHRARYKAAWRDENRETLRHQGRAYARSNQALLAALKDRPCADCGQRFLADVMEFDHVRGTKRYAIKASKMRRKDLAEELAKCELRCANCHRTRHALERLTLDPGLGLAP